MVTPSVKVIFSIASVTNEFDFDQISQCLGIMPTNTRKKSDYPPTGLAQTSWSLIAKENNAKSVGAVMDKVVHQLVGADPHAAAVKISELCDTLDASARFEIVIHMKDGDSPEVVLRSDQILFAAAVGAEIGFDLYCYE